jgi:predicted house-cleaning noncanonical NTP pyrophosphatase (MazG superfamily)
MDIRSAQKIAWDTKLVGGGRANDASLEFELLVNHVATALDTWENEKQEVAERLGVIAVSLLRLAEMLGTDLQEVLEIKLDVSKSAADGRHGKLVRDKIPQIIRSKGEEPIVSTAGTEEYYIRLRDKLREEVEEYLASDNDREELADILEVLYALARETDTDQHELERLRAAKAEKRGGFTDRVIWFCNQPQLSRK